MWKRLTVPVCDCSTYAWALLDDTPCIAAPEKFESKRFCSEKKVILRWYVTFTRIFVVLYMKEPSHATSQTALARGRPVRLRYLLETDERGSGLSPDPSRA